MKAKTFLTGVLVGITAGATLSIAMAPQSGQQLRGRLANNSSRYKQQFAEVIQESENVKQAITAFTYEAKNNIPQIIHELKETISNFKNEIEPETQNIKQEIENLQKSFTEIEQNISKYMKTADTNNSEK